MTRSCRDCKWATLRNYVVTGGEIKVLCSRIEKDVRAFNVCDQWEPWTLLPVPKTEFAPRFAEMRYHLRTIVSLAHKHLTEDEVIKTFIHEAGNAEAEIIALEMKREGGTR